MTNESVTLELGRCLACDQDCRETVTQTLHEGRLSVHWATHCGCPHTHGHGTELPEAERAAFYAQHGHFRLLVVDHGPVVIDVVRIMVHELALERVPALRLLKSADPQVADGTRLEMERLASLFTDAGATVRIDRV